MLLSDFKRDFLLAQGRSCALSQLQGLGCSTLPQNGGLFFIITVAIVFFLHEPPESQQANHE
jgi:hypothetical protein